MSGCTRDEVQPAQTAAVKNPWPDSAMVNVNGTDILKYIKSTVDENYSLHPSDSLLHMAITHFADNGATYYSLSISNIPMRSGQYYIHKYIGGDLYNITQSYYTEIRDYDIIDKEYEPSEADSSANYIQVIFDKPARRFSAAFNLILINKHLQSDTMRMRCDGLYSRW